MAETPPDVAKSIAIEHVDFFLRADPNEPYIFCRPLSGNVVNYVLISRQNAIKAAESILLHLKGNEEFYDPKVVPFDARRTVAVPPSLVKEALPIVQTAEGHKVAATNQRSDTNAPSDALSWQFSNGSSSHPSKAGLVAQTPAAGQQWSSNSARTGGSGYPSSGLARPNQNGSSPHYCAAANADEGQSQRPAAHNATINGHPLVIDPGSGATAAATQPTTDDTRQATDSTIANDGGGGGSSFQEVSSFCQIFPEL